MIPQLKDKDTWRKMVAQLVKPGQAIIDTATPENAHKLHMAVGISGEVAELTDGICAVRVDKANVIEEIGDLLFYIEGMKQGFGLADQDLADAIGELDHDGTYGHLSDENQLCIVAGHILDLAKKEAVYGKPTEPTDMRDHLASLVHVLQGVMTEFGVGEEICIEANWQKLGERYKGHQYSDDAAKERADKPRIKPKS